MPVLPVFKSSSPTVAGSENALPTIIFPESAVVPTITLAAVITPNCALDTFNVPPLVAPTCMLLVVTLGRIVMLLVPALRVVVAEKAFKLLTLSVIGLLFAELFRVAANAPVPRVRLPDPEVVIVVPLTPLAVTVVLAVLPIVIPMPETVVARFTVSAVKLPLMVMAPPEFKVRMLPPPDVPVIVAVVTVAVPPTLTTKFLLPSVILAPAVVSTKLPLVLRSSSPTVAGTVTAAPTEILPESATELPRITLEPVMAPS